MMEWTVDGAADRPADPTLRERHATAITATAGGACSTCRGRRGRGWRRTLGYGGRLNANSVVHSLEAVDLRGEDGGGVVWQMYVVNKEGE